MTPEQLKSTAELATELSRPGPPPAPLLERGVGLHIDVPEDVYHRRALGVVSKGAADKVLESLATYLAWVQGDGDDAESKALMFGSVAHCFALQPDLFASKYVAEPDFGYCQKHDASGTTKEQGADNRRRRDEWRAGHAGAVFVGAKDLSTVRGMREALRQSPDVGHLLRALWSGRDGYHAEATCVWECRESGLICKSRKDLLATPESVIVDLKTCADCREGPFNRSRAEYGYHRQVAHYMDGAESVGLPVGRFLLVAVEKAPPFLHQVYELAPSLIQRGRDQMRRAKMAMVSAITFDEWPGLEPGIKCLGQLPWER